jgi:uncharacterized membrane protein YdbT with pleckstrin-like domain
LDCLYLANSLGYTILLVILGIFFCTLAVMVDDSRFPLIFFLLSLFVTIWGLSKMLGALIQRWTTEIAVTNRRIIVKRGLIWRQSMEMNLNKVESVYVAQSILGRLLNYGNVDVLGTEGFWLASKGNVLKGRNFSRKIAQLQIIQKLEYHKSLPT